MIIARGIRRPGRPRHRRRLVAVASNVVSIVTVGTCPLWSRRSVKRRLNVASRRLSRPLKHLGCPETFSPPSRRKGCCRGVPHRDPRRKQGGLVTRFAPPGTTRNSTRKATTAAAKLKTTTPAIAAAKARHRYQHHSQQHHHNHHHTTTYYITLDSLNHLKYYIHILLLSTYLSTYQPIFLSIYLSTHLSICTGASAADNRILYWHGFRGLGSIHLTSRAASHLGT